MDYVTADLHLGHKSILGYQPRPFRDVEEHDAAIIGNINAAVKTNDRLWIIGDFSFGNPAKYIERINCQDIRLFLGNHDFRWLTKFKKIERVRIYYFDDIDFGVCTAALCHFPIRSWSRRRHGAIHLHGHVHGHIVDPVPGSMDVGVDTNSYKPWNIVDAAAFIAGRDGDWAERIRNGGDRYDKQ